MDLSNNVPVFNAATTPVVLRIIPLPGSLAPIGYIYDPNPARDGDGGLLVAASTFFTHQGHQVFHDPCPDLAAYRKDWRVTATIINMDWLTNHVLAAGLDLLKTPSPPSDVDALGTSFCPTAFLGSLTFYLVGRGIVSSSCFTRGAPPPGSQTRRAHIQPGPFFGLRPFSFLVWLWGAVQRLEWPVNFIVFILHWPITYQFRDSMGVV
jgi:hypothetical protein